MTPHQVVVLRRGDRGLAVADVRDRLVLTGDLPAERTDSAGPRENVEFGEDVELAVKSFQQRRGLLVDGIVGRSTYAVLDGARWSLGDRVLRFLPATPSKATTWPSSRRASPSSVSAPARSTGSTPRRRMPRSAVSRRGWDSMPTGRSARRRCAPSRLCADP